MSKVFRTAIDGQEGFYMRNETNPICYEQCVKLKSARIRSASAMRTLSINKYIPLRYLLVLLREKRLILKPVSSWEDPFENFFLKEQFVVEGDLNKSYSVSVENLTKGLYGMSWSLQNGTSLWRIYSPDKLSIRIKTTVEKIVQTICSEDNKWDVWADKVHYKTEDEINIWLNGCRSTATMYQFANKMSESFFHKEECFFSRKGISDYCELL